MLEGELLIDLGGPVWHLVAGDFTLMPTGMRHALGNPFAGPPGSCPSIPRRDPASGRRDTFFEAAQDMGRMRAAARRPPFGDPSLRFVGHYDGTPPQRDALASPPGARPGAGRDGHGDPRLQRDLGEDAGGPVFGADHLTMFTVDYEPGGAAQAHDHPFEEAYIFLAGEIEAELDGEHHASRRRCGVRRRGLGPWLLQHRHRAGPLARDPGPAAADAPRLSLGRRLEAMRGGSDHGSRRSVVIVGGTGDRPGTGAPLRGGRS